MFRQLAAELKNQVPTPGPGYTAADVVFTFHPMQLSRWLEEVWATGGVANWAPVLNNDPLGDLNAINMFRLPSSPQDLAGTLQSGVNAPGTVGQLPWGYSSPSITFGKQLLWDHMFYAYLVESTGVFEILSEVVRRYVVGESLPSPSINTMAWVRATEEMFFREPPLFHICSPTSQLRPNARINRRRDYWKAIGLDLPHPAPGIEGQPWKDGIAATSNTRFLEMWNELLRQVWLGIENEGNSSGANPTDANFVAYLCQTIGEMLRLRRRGGMLSREEFSDVCAMNWFHLTVDSDNSLVRDLSANTGVNGNPADRLAAIGQRVGIAPSRQARELFELAEKISPLMWAIELTLFDDSSAAKVLYQSSTVASLMNRIIDLWQSATGQNVKDLAISQRRVGAPTRSAQPTKLLPTQTLVTTTAPSTNGHAVASQS